MRKNILIPAISGAVFLSAMTVYAISSDQVRVVDKLGDTVRGVEVGAVGLVGEIEFDGGSGEADLRSIFDPTLFADLDTMTVNPTPDMYEILGAFGITPETHDVDKIMEKVMIEVLDNSETITSDDIGKV